MTAEIIEISTFHHRQRARPSIEASPLEGLSRIGKNEKLRATRDVAWKKADAATKYWLQLADLIHAVEHAQRLKVEAAMTYDGTETDRAFCVQKYREAIAAQILTPAPNLAAVSWKRKAKAGGQYFYAGVKEAQVDKVIFEDEAFLNAHPARQPRRNK